MPNNQISPESSKEQLKLEEPSAEKLWEDIGFHRPLAGFFYKFGYMIIHIIGGIAVAALLYPLMFPFPEIDGYYQTGTNLFVALFVAFDIGTANVMNRFFGENSITNPQKLVNYIQYFIWYQMFSGLIQMTMIAWYVLSMPPESSNLIYLSWIFLMYSTTQYPAMQSVFRNTLNALQQFDKANFLSFLEGDVIQKTSEVLFVLMFRYTLGTNPQYGIILACTMGLVLGKYLDDFMVMGIGMHFFNKSLGKYGITVRVCFRHDFDWALVKETFLFGIKTGLPGLISSFLGLVILIWWLAIPQYTTFISLFGLAASIVNFVSSLSLDLGGAISESYMNNKKALCQYYIGQTWRFEAFVQILMYGVIFMVKLVLEPVLIAIGLAYYIMALPFIIPIMIRRFFNPYERIAGTILTSVHKPNFVFWLDTGGTLASFINWWLILVVWQLPQQLGYAGIIWIMPAGDIIIMLVKMAIAYVYIHKRIVPLKIPMWQTFGGTSIAIVIMVFFGYFLYLNVFIPLNTAYGIWVALIVIIVALFGLIYLVYMPITVFLGVWDDGSVKAFGKAAKMAGFARILIGPFNYVLLKTIPHSRYHNKFAVDDRESLKEAEELMQLRTASQIHNTE